MIVRESIDFKRGISSKQALEIGWEREIPIKDWNEDQAPDGIYLVKNDLNLYHIFLWDHDKKIISFSPNFSQPDFYKRWEDIYSVLTIDALSMPGTWKNIESFLDDDVADILWIKKVEDDF